MFSVIAESNFNWLTMSNRKIKIFLNKLDIKINILLFERHFFAFFQISDHECQIFFRRESFFDVRVSSRGLNWPVPLCHNLLPLGERNRGVPTLQIENNVPPPSTDFWRKGKINKFLFVLTNYKLYKETVIALSK